MEMEREMNISAIAVTDILGGRDGKGNSKSGSEVERQTHRNTNIEIRNKATLTFLINVGPSGTGVHRVDEHEAGGEAD